LGPRWETFADLLLNAHANREGLPGCSIHRICATATATEIDRLQAANSGRTRLRFCVRFVSEIDANSCSVHAASCNLVPLYRNKKTAEISGFLQLLTGAGEGIRTLDPNLGKVVLYP
jgi:hypothetical protein